LSGCNNLGSHIAETDQAWPQSSTVIDGVKKDHQGGGRLDKNNLTIRSSKGLERLEVIQGSSDKLEDREHSCA
jgi:hypothetical protein